MNKNVREQVARVTSIEVALVRWWQDRNPGANYDDATTEEVLTDLLTDLRHAFGDEVVRSADELAQGHYEAEI